jgi:hypothetical protein
MERYIQQLIEDINELMPDQKEETPKQHPLASCFEPVSMENWKEFEMIDDMFESNPVPIAVTTGIQWNELPDPSLLSKNQRRRLAAALEELLQNHGYFLEFPYRFPSDAKYSFLRDFWTTEHIIIPFGQLHFELCNYDHESCPFPDYCSDCTKLAGEEMSNENKEFYF